MLVIKGNLIIKRDKLRIAPLLRQAQNSASSETSSELITYTNMVALADLDKYDISNATVLIGDITIKEIVSDLILVTGEIVQIGGGYDIA